MTISEQLSAFPIVEFEADSLIGNSKEPVFGYLEEGLAKGFAKSTRAQKPYFRIYGERKRRWVGDIFLYGDLSGGDMIFTTVTPCRIRLLPLDWLRDEAPREVLLGLIDDLVRDVVLNISVNMLARDGIKNHLLGTLMTLRQSTNYPEIDLTHEDLSTITGISRARVSNLLKDFERDGLVTTGYKMLQIGSEATLLAAMHALYE